MIHPQVNRFVRLTNSSVNEETILHMTKTIMYIMRHHSTKKIRSKYIPVQHFKACMKEDPNKIYNAKRI